jgi:carbon monoxide dehydrogenase subunit G
MKISGAATMHAPPGRVWTALNDPAVLVRTVPGCEQLEATGPDSYRLTVTAGVASIQGTYTGEIALSERQEPSSFLMTASGAGGPGTVSTSVQVRLVPNGDGSTELSYDADAVVGGMIAGVGQRMLASVAKKMAREFFAAVDDVLTGREVLAPALGAGGPQAAVAGPGAVGEAAGAAASGVYVAPGRGVRRGGPGGRSFQRGVLVGAAIALAGVAVGSLLGRRAR